MNSQQAKVNVEELREAVRQAFQQVAPIPQTDTTWWTDLFDEPTQSISSEIQQSEINVEQLRKSVHQAFSKVASIPQTDTSWWTTLFGDDTQPRSDQTIEMPAYEEPSKVA